LFEAVDVWILNDLTNPEGSFLGGAFGGGMGSGMEGDEDPQHKMVAICINLWYQKVMQVLEDLRS